MAEECVVDTVVLQKSNAALTQTPKAGRLFARRLRLLEAVVKGALVLLVSRQLLAEYARRVPTPRNDFVKVFLELATQPGRAVLNWATPWSGAHRASARRCRYPHEDVHLLRTAVRPNSAVTIYSEEHRLLRANECIYRAFQVRILCLPD